MFMSLFMSGCGGYNYVFRYRLTMSVAVDGEVKSAESVIEVTYYGSSSVGASGSNAYNFIKGVAPIVDLGRYGMLAAAMEDNGTEFYRRKKEYGVTAAPPTSAHDFPSAFDVDLKTLASMRSGKRELPRTLCPVFIWFPPDAPYQQAQQISAEEFSRVIGPRVEFRSITIEAAPDAPVLKRLSIQAPWLDQLRIDQAELYHGNYQRFLVNRQRQLETDRVRP